MVWDSATLHVLYQQLWNLLRHLQPSGQNTRPPETLGTVACWNGAA